MQIPGLNPFQQPHTTTAAVGAGASGRISRPAPLRRVLAFFFDMVAAPMIGLTIYATITFILAIPIGMLTVILGSRVLELLGGLVFGACVLAGYYIYHVYFPAVTRSGVTFAKGVFRMRIVDAETGEPASKEALLKRELYKNFSFFGITLALVLGYYSLALEQKFSGILLALLVMAITMYAVNWIAWFVAFVQVLGGGRAYYDKKAGLDVSMID